MNFSLSTLKDRLAEQRCIFIEKAVTQSISENIIERIIRFNHENDTKPIFIWISTKKGLLSEGLKVYHAMRHSVAPIMTIALGQNELIGCLLISAGKERFGLSDSRFSPCFDSSLFFDQMEASIPGSIEVNDILEELVDSLVSRTQQPPDVVLEALLRFRIHTDLYKFNELTVDWSKNFGLIHAIGMDTVPKQNGDSN